MKKTILGLLLLLGQPGIAGAATVGFDPATSNVIEDDVFWVDIVASGFPATDGGGVDLAFDPSVVNVLSVSIDPTVWNFVTSTGSIDNTAGSVDGIMVNDFDYVDPLAGDFIVATLQLKAVGIGTTLLSLSEYDLNPWASGGTRIDPTYLSGIVNVSPIPLPAAAWLFGSALLGLLGWQRRRATSS